MSKERTGTLLLFATLAWLVSVWLGTIEAATGRMAVAPSLISLAAIVALVVQRTVQGSFGSRH